MAVLDKIVNGVMIIIIAAMSLVVAANVFCRFILNFSLYWADELALVLMVWLTFIGAALAIKDKSHYMLNFLTERLNGNTQRVFLILQQFLVFLSIVTLLYFSVIVAWQIRNWVMPATEVSRTFVYSASPVGCVLMLYYAIRR